MPAHREGRRAVNASFQSGKPGSVLSTLRAFGSIGTTEGLRYIRECRAKAALPQSLCRLGVTSRSLRSFNPGPQSRPTLKSQPLTAQDENSPGNPACPAASAHTGHAIPLARATWLQDRGGRSPWAGFSAHLGYDRVDMAL